LNFSITRALGGSTPIPLHVGGLAPPSCIEAPQLLPQITAEARRYAVKELARRAGVTQEFFKSWNIQVSPGETTISFGPEAAGKIRFFHGREAGLAQHLTDEIPVGRTEWLIPSRTGTASQDLILPFCRVGQNHGPLYQISSHGDLTCTLDLLASLILTLSRVEESLLLKLDEHGRFPATSSLAFREDFLERPILDEHGLAFRQALGFLLPGWQPEQIPFRVKLTHDVDDVGMPFDLRSTLAHSLKRRSPSATVRDLFALISSSDPMNLFLVRKLAAISKGRGLHSAFFWKCSARTPHDSGYSLNDPRIQRMIGELRKSNFEVGVHPGYDTFHHRQSLSREIGELKRALHEEFPGGRQHYLRWTPRTWLDWESCRLRYDSSVGFADHIGFRAGTSFPFRPWCWEENRELNLIEVPLILMDCTLVKYMRLSLQEGLQRVCMMVKRVEETGGLFTLLWHNTPLMDPDYDGWYEAVLNLLDGAKAYDVPRAAANLW
jgi:uncharacterized protein DUF7033